MIRVRKPINLTDKQIIRQITKLKEIVFENYVENQDGTYEGDLNDSVLEIISSLTDERNNLNEQDFVKMIGQGIKKLLEYFDGKVDSINDDVIHFFAFDFMTQTLNFLYGKQYTTNTDDYDFMFN